MQTRVGNRGFAPAALLFVVIALVGLGVGVRELATSNAPHSTELAAIISTRDGRVLADIERQLTKAQKTGGISSSSYRSVESKLKALEKKKIDTTRARTILKQLVDTGNTKSYPGKGAREAEEKRAAGIKGYWQGWETEYKPVGTIPPCPSPLVIPSPVDVSKVTSILYPGQVRGSDYKAHGGFRLDNQSTNEASVRIPLDAEFIYGSRHYQSGEIQYLLGFRMPCGIEYRLDHLLTLSPKFQELVDKHLPPPKYDSLTTEVKPPVPVKAGEIVATEVGFRSYRNIGFDFGVYDLRKKNKQASDSAWVAARKGNSLAPYAICWLDYLPSSEQTIVKALPGADGKMGKTSDFCITGDIVIPTPNRSTAPSAHMRLQNNFEAVRGEIEDAERKNGRFSEEHSVRVLRDLEALEKAGIAKSELERLRAIVYKQSPHLVDIARKEEEARKAALKAHPSAGYTAEGEACDESAPMLTADITDFSKITKITAPGSPSFEGPKGHSFIWTGDVRVPLYAPVAGVYDSGSYYKDSEASKAEYLLFFRVKGSCGYQFKFDHVLEPLEAIRAQLPSEPKISDSRGTPATQLIEFKAGEIIGYTSKSNLAGNWDFGLYNMKAEGALKAHGCSATHCNAVCWPDFYTAEKKMSYRALLEGPKLLCAF